MGQVVRMVSVKPVEIPRFVAEALQAGLRGLGTWQPIPDDGNVPEWTIADLRLKSGRLVRAFWGPSGNATAWWPFPGQQSKHFIALYQPAEFKPLSCGAHRVVGALLRGDAGKPTED